MSKKKSKTPEVTAAEMFDVVAAVEQVVGRLVMTKSERDGHRVILTYAVQDAITAKDLKV